MSDPFDAIDRLDGFEVPIDPADLVACESCQ